MHHDGVGRELRALLALAVPVMLSRAGLLVMTTVDTVMTGWAGADELAYLAIGLAPFIILMLVATGLLTGTAVLTAQASGAGELPACGRVWHTALLDAAIAGALTLLLLRHTGAFLLATGQTPAITAGGAGVAWMLALGMPAMLGYIASTLFLEGLGRPRVGVVIVVAGNLVNIPLNALLIGGGLGLPPMGAAGAALATSIVRWLMLAAIVAWILRRPDLHAHAVHRIRPSWSTQRKLLRLGVPFAVSQGLETSAFQTLTLFCGWLGTTALAAYQIAFNVTALVYMATVGLATATAVRVGHGIGAQAPGRAVAAAWLGLAATLAVMCTMASCIGLCSHGIVRLYSADPLVLALAPGLLLLVAVVVVLDGAQGVATGALRGAADVFMPMVIHVAAFWLVLLPVAWLLAFRADLGVHGLLGGVIAGLAVAAALLLRRLHGLPARGLARL